MIPIPPTVKIHWQQKPKGIVKTFDVSSCGFGNISLVSYCKIIIPVIEVIFS
jgi:hypothetical protein